MKAKLQRPPSIEPAIARLARLAPLDDADHAALLEARSSIRRIAAHREIVAEGAPVAGAGLILDGWACRVRFFPDGRRQILSLLLPGDLIGIGRQPRPLAPTAIAALTDVTVCALPVARTPGLAEAYAVSGALEEHYLFRQLARLGRLSAYERLIDYMLEIRERLGAADIGDQQSFPMPLTQEVLGDALGLTSVHINRTLQAMRRDGLIVLKDGVAQLANVERLARLVDARPPRVSRDQAGRPSPG